MVIPSARHLSLLIAGVLTLSLALAQPAALQAWLLGGHVTPEQGWWHQAVVTRHGDHIHVNFERAEGHPAVAGALVSLTMTGPAMTSEPSATSPTLWKTVLLSLLVSVTLALFARLPSPRPRRLTSAHRVVPSPPPQSLLLSHRAP